MKKSRKVKSVVIMSTVIITLFIVSNIATYVTFKENLIETIVGATVKCPVNVIDYFKLSESEINKRDLYADNQVVQLGDYTVKLEQVYNKKKDNKCYCRFSVRNDKIDMRDVVVRETPKSAMGFVQSAQSVQEEDIRFFFFVSPDMGTGTIGENGGFQQKKDVMYVYYMFELEGEGIRKVDYIYLYDKDAGKDGYTEFDSTPKCAAAKFKIK